MAGSPSVVTENIFFISTPLSSKCLVKVSSISFPVVVPYIGFKQHSSSCNTPSQQYQATTAKSFIQGVPEYMTQFQNFIKNKQVKIQRKLKYFLKGYEMPFQFSSLLQVVLKIVSLKWRPPMSMQF